ncbi:tRNA 2-thiouridine(34) synthase MnmA [Myxococcota bacterium]|nr:tRNA 2-thiouridine(34) synthase MnmA [Myxococcota bacterium]
MTTGHFDFAVGMSGGVDSSVTAALLKAQGYSVVGLTMKIWDGAVQIQEGLKHACYGPGEEEDIAAAEAVCGQLGMELVVVDLCGEYRTFVLDYFRAEYLAGRTPNPCVVCNKKVKFGFLLEKAAAAGVSFDRFATGHYARIVERDGRLHLRRALDRTKDQTYFIHQLVHEQLQRIAFPLGDLTKLQVRDIARQNDLAVAERAESQDFISGGDYSVLFEAGQIVPGDIVDEQGNVLGRHNGFINYTIGQRKGLGIASTEPWYVYRIVPQRNQVIVSRRQDILSAALDADSVIWAAGAPPAAPLHIAARIRQKHAEAPALVTPTGPDTVRVTFDDPQLAVTPGQAVVFYDDDLVLGGGIISSSSPNPSNPSNPG